MVYAALEKVKQKPLQPDAAALRPKMKSRREEGRGGRAGFRSRVVAKPAPGELPIFLLLATITPPPHPPSSLGRGRREEPSN